VKLEEKRILWIDVDGRKIIQTFNPKSGPFLLRVALFLKQSDLGKYKKEKINL